MELALVVYVISLVSSFHNVIIPFLIIGAFISVGLGMFALANQSYPGYNNRSDWEASVPKYNKIAKWAIGIWISLILLTIIIPTEKTAYMMVGAYTAQKVAENEKVGEMGSKVIKIIDLKLNEFIDEAEKQITEKAKGKSK